MILQVNDNVVVYSTVAFSHLSRSLLKLNEKNFTNISSKEPALITTLENLINGVEKKPKNNLTINTEFIIYQVW